MKDPAIPKMTMGMDMIKGLREFLSRPSEDFTIQERAELAVELGIPEDQVLSLEEFKRYGDILREKSNEGTDNTDA